MEKCRIKESEICRSQVFTVAVVIIPLMLASSIVIFFGPLTIGALIYYIRTKSKIKSLWFYFILAIIGSAAGNALFFLRNIGFEATAVVFGMDIIAFILGYWAKYVQDH